MSDVVTEWRERIRAAAAKQTPLRIVGGGTKDFYGQELYGDRFDTGGHRGLGGHALHGGGRYHRLHRCGPSRSAPHR